MNLLTKEQIDSKKDWKSTVVDVPEWGGSVMVREMDTGAYIEYVSRLSKVKDEVGSDDSKLSEIAAFVAASTICDELGRQMFSENEIKSKPLAVVERIFDVAMDLNRGDNAGVVEEKEGN